MQMPSHPNYLKTPSVGRIVHYVARGSADGKFPPVDRAAVITGVQEEMLEGPQRADLCVLNPQGIFFDYGLYQDEEDHKPGTWHWPEQV